MSTIAEQIAAIPRPTYEAVEVGESAVLFNIAKQGVRRHTEPVRAPEKKVEPTHVSLLDLSERQLARTALKAQWYDWKSFGRTSMYELFKERLQEERDAQAMVDLHIVDAVHCRLHERMVDKARGIEEQGV